MLHPTQGEIFQKESWIGGPTYIFQKQHIPGYQGHVPSLNAESLFSKNFARLTSNCLENRVEKGFIINEHQRFQTTNKAEFGLPDLRKAPLTVTAEQILEDYHKKNQLIELIKENEEKKYIFVLFYPI